MAKQTQKDWVPLDIAQQRGKARNIVYRVGIELEGGWDKLPPGVRLVHDGSVVFPQMVNAVGELPSGILDVVNGSPTYWATWLATNFPHHVNDTCGMHVHLSFKTAFAYNRLMTPQYPATVVAEFRRWATEQHLADNHAIWPRLANKSKFCQHKFFADEQVQQREKDHDQARMGHRYTVINYAYGRYSTVECRLLPMMATYDQSRAAVQELLDVTNAFLLALPNKREEKHRMEHKTDDQIDRVETRIYV